MAVSAVGRDLVGGPAGSKDSQTVLTRQARQAGFLGAGRQTLEQVQAFEGGNGDIP
jgi:hypothetical protein